MVAEQRTTAFIPLRGSDQQLAISPETLPDDVYDIIEVLRTEAPARRVWTKVARAFCVAGRLEDGIQVLEDALSPGNEQLLAATDSNEQSKLELLVALGGAFVLLAQDTAVDESTRTECRSKAANSLNAAESINIDSPVLWEAKAWKELYENNLERARSFFETAASIGRATAAGRLGMAALLVNFQDHASSLKLFRSTLRNVRCPTSAWVGFAHSFYAKGSVNNARSALERTVKACSEEHYSREAVEALIGLAAIRANEDSKGGVLDALGLLNRALQSQEQARIPPDPRILSHAAELLFYMGDAQLAEALATRAVKTVHDGTPPLVTADAVFQFARISHAAGRFQDAMEQYRRSIQLQQHAAKDNVVPQVQLGFGLLNLALPEGDHAKVVDSLQTVLKINDKCSLARRALGVALARSVLKGSQGAEDASVVQQRSEQAKSLLKQGLAEEGGEDDIPALVSYAQLVEKTAPQSAVEMYKKALDAFEKRGEPQPVELLNNVATLQARTDQLDAAKESLAKCLANARKQDGLGEDEPLGAQHVTLLYNYARLLEMSGDLQGAEKHYRDISERFKGYSDASVRLGCILRNRGDLAGAEQLMRKVMESGSQNSAAYATSYLISIFEHRRDFATMQKLLEQANNKKLDQYAEVALAAFWSENLSNLEAERKDRMLERIHRAFSKVEIGRQISQRNREMRAPTDSSNFQQAAKLYSDAIEKTEKGRLNMDIQLSLSRALFEAGEYDEALKVMQRVLHMNPQFLPLWFRMNPQARTPGYLPQKLTKHVHNNRYNLALCLQERSSSRMETHSKIVKQIKRGTEELDRAHRIFGRLRNFQPYEGSGPARCKPTPQAAEGHYRYCKERLNKARVVLVNAEQEEKNVAERMEQQKKEIEEHMAREESAKEEERRKREEAKRQLEERQRLLDEKVQNDSLRQDNPEEGVIRSSEDDAENDSAPKQASRPKARKRKVVQEGDGDVPDESTNVRRSKLKRRRAWSESESGEGSHADDDELQIFGGPVDEDGTGDGSDAGEGADAKGNEEDGSRRDRDEPESRQQESDAPKPAASSIAMRLAMLSDTAGLGGGGNSGDDTAGDKPENGKD